MKVNLKQLQPKNGSLFPCLARFTTNPNGDFIVLFSEDGIGTVVYSALQENPVGLHLDNWIPLNEGNHWELLDSLTLEFTNNV